MHEERRVKWIERVREEAKVLEKFYRRHDIQKTGDLLYLQEIGLAYDSRTALESWPNISVSLLKNGGYITLMIKTATTIMSRCVMNPKWKNATLLPLRKPRVRGIVFRRALGHRLGLPQKIWRQKEQRSASYDPYCPKKTEFLHLH